MLYGVVASRGSTGGGGGSPVIGDPPNIGMGTGEFLIDFLNEVYRVEGVDYALSDLFTDAPGGRGTAQLGTRVVPGRGYRSDYTSPDIGALADGPLFTLLRSPITYWAEWEDFDVGARGGLWYGVSALPGDCYIFVDVTTPSLDAYWPNNIGGGSVSNGDASGSQKFGGTNRFAVTLGTTADNIAMNGFAPSASNLNGSGLFGAGTYQSDEPLPLGAAAYSGDGDVMGGWIRWIAGKPPLASSADLGPLTTLSTPAAVTRASITVDSVTSTTATISFTNAAGATEHEAIIMLSTQTPDVDLEFPIQPLTNNGSGSVITGLDPNTSYRAYIRGRNSYGPGPFYQAGGYCRATFTTSP